ncbi:MAG: ribonuclease Y [Candidatus Nitrospinota bacterium M3_3B_026]
METAIIILGALAAGFGAGYYFKRVTEAGRAAELSADAERVLERARQEASTVVRESKLEAKETLLKAQADFEKKAQERKNEMEQFEKRLLQREKILDSKYEQAERRERDMAAREKDLAQLEGRLREKIEEAGAAVEKQLGKLQEISRMSAEEAREEMKAALFDDARLEAANNLKKIEERTKEEASEKAGQIISLAIQRLSTDHVAENTVSVVDLPSDEMKGRIIGREGRNIRALEVATGVDLIIDDTPNAVILSCFDPIKREVARLTLQRLINDGRIHPGRIEDTVEKVSKEMNAQLRENGEKAIFELGIDGIHQELVRLLGRLKFRTSYSQNVLRHSIEVGYLAGIMAAELGQNVKLAKRAGLMHDIGKAVDQDTEGTHVQIGMELARRYNEPKAVINSIASHHEDHPAESVIAVLVAAADALSASRPGARREMLQNYIARMQKLEEIGDSFDGVEKTFAIQAGREVRVVVKPDAIGDNEAFFLSRDIAKKIEEELAYPGEIRVTVIRETRITNYAK